MKTARAHAIHDAIPYLCVHHASDAIDFYSRAFGAVEEFRISGPDGDVAHAEVKFGPTLIMLVDENPDYGVISPRSLGGTPMRMHLHVENVDALAERAVDAGATMFMEPRDQPHGERQCRLLDPFGHEWLLGHQIEEVSREEMKRRYEDGS